MFLVRVYYLASTTTTMPHLKHTHDHLTFEGASFQGTYYTSWEQQLSDTGEDAMSLGGHHDCLTS